MDKKNFLHAFDELLELEDGATTESDELSKIAAWDSLSVLGFIAFVDQNFGTVLSPQDIYNAKTVGDLMALLGSKIT